MYIIDRYILRQFLQTFTICFVSLAGVYVVFDAFTNLENFLRAADRHGGLFQMLGTYYAYRSLWFFDRTVGLLNLTAAMFTAAWIQRHNELVALMAAGISRIRVMVPVIAAVLAIIVLGAVNRELVIPRCRHELARRPQDLTGTTARELLPQYDNETDILIRGKGCFPEGLRVDAPRFRFPPSLDHYAKQITAREATWRSAEADRPAGYLLDGVEQPKDLDSQPSLMFRDRPLVITFRDAPDWLRPGQCFIASQVTFEQLTAGLALRDFSSTSQLVATLRTRSSEYNANLRVAIHARFVQPLLDAVLLFLGLPLVLHRQSRNVFLALMLCGVVVGVFWLVVMVSQYVGSLYPNYLTVAVWVPLMIFVPIAVELVHSLTK